MLPRHQDPIVAIATANGRGAVGIVRVSGTDLAPLIDGLFGRTLAPRHATYLAFPDAQGVPIDHGLAIHFPSPHSYTGEDVLELQAHGGPVVLQLLLANCLRVAGESAPDGSGARLPHLRLARPGEFTERAFLNDKLDLAQAEAVSDLIDASTEAAARSAGRSLRGEFSAQVLALRDGLIELRMLVEATLDFPEEEIDFLEQADARGRLHDVARQLAQVAQRARQGALLREGMTVVLAGQPNAGKSSLLNALAGAELAIVTEIAGTTRDAVTGTVQIEGVPVHVIDTAGLRDADDEVERLGVARSWQQIDRADAVLFLHDLTRIAEPDHARADERIEGRLPPALMHSGRVLNVYNKSDLVDATALQGRGLLVSARTGEGLAELRAELLRLAGWQAHTEGVFVARTRHLQALRRAADHLERSQRWLDDDRGALDLLAEELRSAHDALSEIVGAYSSEDLLGAIFSHFCIGK